MVTNFGSSYWYEWQLNGFLAVNDKSQLTVSCWFAVQMQMQLSTKLPSESVAPPPSSVAQTEGLSNSQEVVGRVRAHVMRLMLKQLRCTKKMDRFPSVSLRFGDCKNVSPLL